MATPEKIGECSTLPTYSPSGPSPQYSCDPSSDERTLQRTPRANCSPTGAFTKKSGGVTVTLFEQENDVEMPTYGRRGRVNGTIYLENNELISQIILRIEGKLESNSSEGGIGSIDLLSDSYTLWTGSPGGGPCPALISFSFGLPTTFSNGDSKQPLPPSYVSEPAVIPCVSVRSHYSIHVHIERARHRNISFLRKRKHIKIPFIYQPRTRAHRPIIASPGFFSTIKTSPEEWHQAATVIKTQSSSRLDPIHTHLFVPAGRVYSITDTIPFHLQLNSSLYSLQSFLLPPSQDEAIIRVILLRQVQIETKGQTTSQNVVIGEGKLSEIPPLAYSSCEHRDNIHLDWEGTMKCKKDTSVGGFIAGNISVRDFVVLDIKPPKHGHEFLPLQVLVPIRLVTDPYLETDYPT